MLVESDAWTVFAALTVALIIDWLIGDPQWLYRRLPHPVVLFGNGIGILDRALNRGEARKTKGLLVLLVVVIVAAVVGAAGHVALDQLTAPAGVAIEALLVSVFVAQRGLFDHVGAVARALERGGLGAGRSAVSHLVGRDPNTLNEPAVCRAAIESLAENFSDGVIAPVFWYLVLGLPGLLVYKAVNTADSMIGHKTERHREFGWAAARFDDLVNWIPARLTGLLLALAAWVLPGASIGRAWTAMARDARRHTSPNAGWPEAAMAGALGFALAGPRRYGDKTVDGAWMGRGRSGLNPKDIRQSLVLYCWSCGGLLVASAGTAMVLRAL